MVKRIFIVSFFVLLSLSKEAQANPRKDAETQTEMVDAQTQTDESNPLGQEAQETLEKKRLINELICLQNVCSKKEPLKICKLAREIPLLPVEEINNRKNEMFELFCKESGYLLNKKPDIFDKITTYDLKAELRRKGSNVSSDEEDSAE